MTGSWWVQQLEGTEEQVADAERRRQEAQAQAKSAEVIPLPARVPLVNAMPCIFTL